MDYQSDGRTNSLKAFLVRCAFDCQERNPRDRKSKRFLDLRDPSLHGRAILAGT